MKETDEELLPSVISALIETYGSEESMYREPQPTEQCDFPEETTPEFKCATINQQKKGLDLICILLTYSLYN